MSQWLLISLLACGLAGAAGQAVAQTHDPCLTREDAHGFTATYRATSIPASSLMDPLSISTPYTAVIDLRIEMPVLGQRVLVESKTPLQPSMSVEITYGRAGDRDKGSEFVFRFDGAALNSMLARSKGSRDLICRFRTGRGSEHAAKLEISQSGAPSCTIATDELDPGRDANGQPFRIAVQSSVDGIAYFVADYPSGLPGEITSSLSLRVEDLSIYAQRYDCAYGHSRTPNPSQ